MNKRHARAALKGLCLTAVALAPAAALAEEVRLTLRNGGSVCGVITSEAGGTVTFTDVLAVGGEGDHVLAGLLAEVLDARGELVEAAEAAGER